MTGKAFDLLPVDAIGILAKNNDNPLELRNTSYPPNLLDIAEKSDETLTLNARQVTSHIDAYYLGAIISADRETVYWVNESRPLP